MNENHYIDTRRYYLHPGELFVSDEDFVISTILGSCVAVCLWDGKKNIGGMNHVMFPICEDKFEGSTKYGNVGTYVLYDLMKKKGSLNRSLNARVFGGSCGFEDGNELIAVGKKNIDVSMNVLDKLKIPVIGSDVGGSRGRKILFDLRTGKIKMFYLGTENK